MSILAFLVLTSSALLSVIFNRHKSVNIDIVFFITLFFIVGFRFHVGADYESYIGWFNNVVDFGSAGGEIGFDIISFIAIALKMNYQGMFLIFSLITSFFFYLGYRYFAKDSVYLKLTFFLIFIIFVYPLMTNGIRQVTAASIIFYASKYCIEKKLIKFLMLVFLASLFHTSAVLLFPLYFILNLDFNRTLMIATLISSFVIASFHGFTKFMIFVVNELQFLDVGGYVSTYLNNRSFQDFSFGVVAWIQVLMLLIIIFFKNCFGNKKALFSLNGFFFYTLFLIFAYDSRIFTRLSVLFSVFPAMTIAFSIELFDKDSRFLAGILITFAYIFLLLFLIYFGYSNPDFSSIFPYRFNFNIFD